MTYEHNVHFAAAYDKRAEDPKKNFGIHGVHITFTVKKGGEGLTFSISTNWQLPHVQAETDSKPGPAFDRWMFHKPMAFGVDYHSLKPHYEDQASREHCEVTGQHCYCDGSGLLGEEFLQTLIEGGDEALWKRMEEQFEEWCGQR